MEKNYKLRIGRYLDRKATVEEYFETLGQAIIRVKTYGAEQRDLDKCSYQVDWRITDFCDNQDNNNLSTVEGDYTAGWEPIIKLISTFV